LSTVATVSFPSLMWHSPSLSPALSARYSFAVATSSSTHLPWRPVTPRDGESVRWECVDGRWVAIGLGTGKRAGLAFVHHSGVLCEYVETYEQAIALAKKWRTI